MTIGTEPVFIEELNLPLSPADMFARLRKGEGMFFLDSAGGPQHLSRYSLLGCQPYLLLKSFGRRIELRQDERSVVIEGNPFHVLRELLGRFRIDARPLDVSFIGGAVGYLAYDLGRFVERLPTTARADLSFPEMYFGFYRSALIYDHRRAAYWVVSASLPEDADAATGARAGEALAREMRTLASQAEPAPEPLPRTRPHPLESNFTRPQYLRAVEKALQYIAAGDIYQVNLSQRFQTERQLPFAESYQRLRAANPAPFAAYLDLGDRAVLSSSPERFLKVTGGLVETRPIKGTRPRLADAQADACMKQALWSSAKDNAELAMIVDLERNDLGRVCDYGSVKVTQVKVLESFARVHHLVATVGGTLHADKDVVDLLKATFPGGSITGAPKIRSMEIIDELEPTRRGIYTGAIGYISFNGDMDLNIVIRTMLATAEKIYFQVGGGIVADSSPEAEYQETLDKARALIESL